MVVVRYGAVSGSVAGWWEGVDGRERGADGFIYCVIGLEGFVAVETEQVTWLMPVCFTYLFAGRAASM
jgi:hypothetical protein